ncbi:MAG TPA: fatty acid desaturase family protein [Polyangiaceae bacterium LLY-WYZ-15_(1-7)]|nr:fatty acid desaturase [Myxococcales bacterium]MAT28228.1 fatty acid desaturase [Sandaracinus sp.]HJK95502.1 fatty acid desaturase family protein [Polyangiaceae bacterium LLY-WYZ-15_(1-7)]MBJ75311.1 fatty acid desaturase [Sandaracinus sp.]HJL05948.1 fatty acid desaturase family protein [Polyangiaceae bacterium LLY-WYZ-15_(1-7)]
MSADAEATGVEDAKAPTKITAVLSREEIAELTRASDLRGALSLLTDWGIVAGAMALVACFPHALTVLLALALIGSRQLALAVLTHECAHRSLFRTKGLHDLVGTWLCAAPVWADLVRYREHHRRHHVHAGTEGDPDRGLVEAFPTSRASLARKLLRDLVGWTGARRVLGLLAIDLAYVRYTASTFLGRAEPRPFGARLRHAARHLGPVLLTNGALLGLLWALGHPRLYLLWVGAWMTTYSLVLRLRAIAEHACTEWSPNPWRNTRTTRAGLLARLFLAPHHVNFHLEHHLLMTVPHYRLPELHRLLAERGMLDARNTAPGYLAVLRRVTTIPAA